MQHPQQIPQVDKKLIDQLNKLIELEFDAIGAYEEAVKRLESRELAATLDTFLADHRRHLTELTEAVLRLGGRPKTKGDAKGILTKGKVVLGDIVGDRGIIKAMDSNEKETNAKYEAALKLRGLPPNVLSLLERALDDERTHKRWTEAQVKAMK
jgi:uncharacterized protein (TIGR02284 family)